MSISVNRKAAAGVAARYLIAAILCAVFGAVYEVFSHEVYTVFMYGAFLIPLLLGALPFGITALAGWAIPSRFTRYLYHSGVATATVGCLFEGVLIIYGTTNKLIYVYISATVLLFSAALIGFIRERSTTEKP